MFPPRQNTNDFSDPVTFLLVPSPGQNLSLVYTKIYISWGTLVSIPAGPFVIPKTLDTEYLIQQAAWDNI